MPDEQAPETSPEEALERLAKARVLPRQPEEAIEYLISGIDTTNGLWRARFDSALFHITQLRPLWEMTKPCDSPEAFSYRIQSLALIIDEMDVDKEKYGRGLTPDHRKPINLLERLLDEEAPHFEQRGKIIDTLRNIRALRNLYPAHQDTGKSIQALRFFGFSYPLRRGQEQALWDKVRAEFLECLPLLQEAIALEKAFPGLMQAAHWALCSKEWQRCVDLCERAIRLNPDAADPYACLACVYYGLGRHQDAVEACRKVLRLSPDNVGAYLLLAESYEAMGHASEAVEACEVAERLSDKRAAVAGARSSLPCADVLNAWRFVGEETYYLWIGKIYFRLARYQAAIEPCRKAIRDYPPVYWAYSTMGEAYWKMGLYKEALREFKNELHNQLYVSCYTYEEAAKRLADAYMTLGRYRDALKTYKQAVLFKKKGWFGEDIPDVSWAHRGLGHAYRGLGVCDKALDAYKEAIRLEPNDAEAHWGMGLVYAKLGRFEEAEEQCQKLEGLNRDLAARLKKAIAEARGSSE